MSLESHFHAELLRAQWRLIELLEAMPPNDARELLEVELELQMSESAAAMPELRPWPQLPEDKAGVYASPTNRTRMYRVCRMLESSDRLLDIGTNVGFFAGVLASLVRPAGYTGIDLHAKYLDGVRAMAKANDLAIDHWNLEVGDLYELTPEWVAKQDPTILLLLEVLEHLPDPQAALRTLAGAMPPEAELLFSVPMLGRLEACWGHHSLFDAERVRQLCAEAGLHIHWVEPLVNTWKLVLVSPSPKPPQRMQRIIEHGLPARPAVTIEHPGFRGIRLKDDAVPVANGKLSVEERGVRVEAAAAKRLLGKGPASSAGLSVPVDGLRALRLEVQGTDTSGIEAMIVEGKDADGEPTCRWELTPTEQKPMARKPITYVFRPGQAAAGYRSKRNVNAEGTRTVEITMRLRPGRTGSFALRRAAYVR